MFLRILLYMKPKVRQIWRVQGVFHKYWKGASINCVDSFLDIFEPLLLCSQMTPYYYGPYPHGLWITQKPFYTKKYDLLSSEERSKFASNQANGTLMSGYLSYFVWHFNEKSKLPLIKVIFFAVTY